MNFLMEKDRSKIAFMSNATEALNTAINGMIQSGDHVVTTVMEHNSVLRPLYLKETDRGLRLTVLPLDENGLISSEALKRRFVRIRKRLFVRMHRM